MWLCMTAVVAAVENEGSLVRKVAVPLPLRISALLSYRVHFVCIRYLECFLTGSIAIGVFYISLHGVLAMHFCFCLIKDLPRTLNIHQK